MAANPVWMEFEIAEYAISRAFPLTLGGIARTWFIGLRLGTIESFRQLEYAFAAQFIKAHPMKKSSFHLSLIVQREIADI